MTLRPDMSPQARALDEFIARAAQRPVTSLDYEDQEGRLYDIQATVLSAHALLDAILTDDLRPEVIRASVHMMVSTLDLLANGVIDDAVMFGTASRLQVAAGGPDAERAA